MCLRIGKLLIESPGGFLAQGRVRLHHVKGVHIGVVHVHAGGNPAFLQVLDIPHRLGIEWLAVPHDLIDPNAQPGGVGLHVQQRRITVVQRRRIGRGQGQPIPRRHHRLDRCSDNSRIGIFSS